MSDLASPSASCPRARRRRRSLGGSRERAARLPRSAGSGAGTVATPRATPVSVAEVSPPARRRHAPRRATIVDSPPGGRAPAAGRPGAATALGRTAPAAAAASRPPSTACAEAHRSSVCRTPSRTSSASGPRRPPLSDFRAGQHFARRTLPAGASWPCSPARTPACCADFTSAGTTSEDDRAPRCDAVPERSPLRRRAEQVPSATRREAPIVATGVGGARPGRGSPMPRRRCRGDEGRAAARPSSATAAAGVRTVSRTTPAAGAWSRTRSRTVAPTCADLELA